MKRLYRSKNDRMLGGVCAGLGEHLDIDPTVIPACLGGNNRHLNRDGCPGLYSCLDTHPGRRYRQFRTKNSEIRRIILIFHYLILQYD